MSAALIAAPSARPPDRLKLEGKKAFSSELRPPCVDFFALFCPFPVRSSVPHQTCRMLRKIHTCSRYERCTKSSNLGDFPKPERVKRKRETSEFSRRFWNDQVFPTFYASSQRQTSARWRWIVRQATRRSGLGHFLATFLPATINDVQDRHSDPPLLDRSMPISILGNSTWRERQTPLSILYSPTLFPPFTEHFHPCGSDCRR